MCALPQLAPLARRETISETTTCGFHIRFQDADLHVIDHQRHPLRIACIFERLRNVQAVDAFHVLTPNEILRSGPAAFRKYAPGLTSRAVSALADGFRQITR